jgi:CDP-glucose 4,6-dehydratase
VGFGESAVEALVSSAPLEEILKRSYEGRRILITGHNGFVGTWLSLLLARAGARVTGFSLPMLPGSLAESLGLPDFVESIDGDITEISAVEDVFAESAPELVFHLAAQAQVLASYREPIVTFATNVMGTAHVLESLRSQRSAQGCVIVTSDKCYATAEGSHVETDPLGGDDPYSASKAAAEIVAHAYRTSYFSDGPLAVATTRAGNIVGGGDWADDRIVPDCARAVRAGKPVTLRRPDAVRPWQHVLDAIAGYLRLGDALVREPTIAADAWNFGPPVEAAATVGEFVSDLVARWRARGVTVHDPVLQVQPPVAERATLTLDSSKARSILGWRPMLDLGETIDWSVSWYAAALGPTPFDALAITSSQIARYLELDLTASAGALRPSSSSELLSTNPGAP